MGTIVIRQSASQIVDYTYNSRGREQQQQVKGNIQQLQLQLSRALSYDRQPPCGYDFAHEKQTKPETETETEPKTKTKPNSIGDLRHLVSLPLSLLLYKGIQVYIYMVYMDTPTSIYISVMYIGHAVCLCHFICLITNTQHIQQLPCLYYIYTRV